MNLYVKKKERFFFKLLILMRKTKNKPFNYDKVVLWFCSN